MNDARQLAANIDQVTQGQTPAFREAVWLRVLTAQWSEMTEEQRQLRDAIARCDAAFKLAQDQA